jgi:hypothetical protein
MTRANISWEWDGLSLNNHAWDVRALGAPEQVPGMRGENVLVPHKTGRTHTIKFRDERLLALACFVKGCDPDHGGDYSGSWLWQNLDTLRAKFAQVGEYTLKCKAATNETRIATAEIQSVVEFVPEGPDHYGFLVEYKMADPWWYAENGATIGPTPLTSSPINVAVENEGTYMAEKPVYTFTGAITNPKLTMTALGVTCWLLYTGAVAAGKTLVIYTGLCKALLDGVDVSGNITHDGVPWWLPIEVGTNTLTVTASYLGTGPNTPTLTVGFTPAFV